MYRLVFLGFVALLLQMACFPAPVRAAGIEEELAVRLYVVRRPLGIGADWKPLTNLNQFAHSAVLLETEAKNFALLEYMSDGRVYLTQVAPNVIETHEVDSYVTLTMVSKIEDGSVKEFRWTRQLLGTEVSKAVKIGQLRDEMQRQMAGRAYSVTTHNCHMAQEALRRSLGLVVK